MKLVGKLLSCQVVELLASEGAGEIASNSTLQLFNNRKAGGTFIEVMMACVVLAVFAVLGSPFIVQTMGYNDSTHYPGSLTLHRNRCQALAIANSRMEQIRATPYGVITNLINSGLINISWKGGWINGDETFNLPSAQGLALKTGVQYWDAAPSVAGNEAVMITVQAAYIPGLTNYVTLKTIYGP